MPDQYTFYRQQEQEASLVLRSESLMQVSTAEECSFSPEFEAWALRDRDRKRGPVVEKMLDGSLMVGPPDRLNPAYGSHLRRLRERDFHIWIVEKFHEIKAESLC